MWTQVKLLENDQIIALNRIIVLISHISRKRQREGKIPFFVIFSNTIFSFSYYLNCKKDSHYANSLRIHHLPHLNGCSLATSEKRKDPSLYS